MKELIGKTITHIRLPSDEDYDGDITIHTVDRHYAISTRYSEIDNFETSGDISSIIDNEIDAVTISHNVGKSSSITLCSGDASVTFTTYEVSIGNYYDLQYVTYGDILVEHDGLLYKFNLRDTYTDYEYQMFQRLKRDQCVEGDNPIPLSDVDFMDAKLRGLIEKYEAPQSIPFTYSMTVTNPTTGAIHVVGSDGRVRARMGIF